MSYWLTLMLVLPTAIRRTATVFSENILPSPVPLASLADLPMMLIVCLNKQARCALEADGYEAERGIAMRMRWWKCREERMVGWSGRQLYIDVCDGRRLAPRLRGE